MTKRPWVIHPFLLALFPTLYLYTQNLRNVDGSDAILPIGLSLLVVAVIFAGLRGLRVDGPTSGLVSSSVLVLFFSFSHGVRLCERLGLGPDRPTREATVLIAEGIVLGSVGVVVWKGQSLARVVNDGCNASSVALIGNDRGRDDGLDLGSLGGALTGQSCAHQGGCLSSDRAPSGCLPRYP